MSGRFETLVIYHKAIKRKHNNLPYELNDEVRTKLATIIPDNPNKPYDMHEVIGGIIDEDSFFEIHKNYAENILVGFARLGGKALGLLQSTHDLSGLSRCK
jgi:propionyl-CoA carboxylase beta chain